MKTESSEQAMENQKNAGNIFEKIYQEHSSAVYGFGCYLTRQPGEAEDLVQDNWLRIAKHLPEKSSQRGIKTWIFTIAANLYRDSLRKKRIRNILNLGFLHTETRDGSKSSDIGRDISRALDKLPDRQRQVFVLKEIEGFQQDEIVKILNIPLGTVKSLMYRAVRRLQQELAEYQPKSIIKRGNYVL